MLAFVAAASISWRNLQSAANAANFFRSLDSYFAEAASRFYQPEIIVKKEDLISARFYENQKFSKIRVKLVFKFLAINLL